MDTNDALELPDVELVRPDDAVFESDREETEEREDHREDIDGDD